jgi:Flp pilus assembly protein TadG
MQKGSREEGAVAIIVAICLIVLMAAVALTVDIGGLLYRRREMVNGADAAALAAAIECSRVNGRSPEPAADARFLANSPRATAGDVAGPNITEILGCGTSAGHVTVTYTTQQPLYFAPALGFSNQHEVTTEATASWGSVGPFPISVNMGPSGPFHTCNIDAMPGNYCYYLFDNNANGNGDFGFLSLAQWNWPSEQGCNAAGGANLLGDQITGTALHSRYAFGLPAYVCKVSGAKIANWSKDLASIENQTRWFPINDPSKETRQRYYIVGFAEMLVMDVDTNVRRNQSCGGLTSQNASNTCVQLQWIGGGVGKGPELLETVILCDLQYGTDPVKGTCLG